jgi:hypothetical protein
MQSESQLRSEPDEAIDAIVEEPMRLFRVRPEDVYRPPAIMRFEPPAPAQYVVPRQFGMSAIIGIITALAVLFGAFRVYNAPPVLYLFFGVQAIVICLAQMLYGKTPRAASAITGAVLLPLFLGVGMAYWNDRRSGELIYWGLLVGTVPVGAFLGYITGTLAAGVFLLMDSAERLLAVGRAVQLAGLERR